jgi:hypothetical protein
MFEHLKILLRHQENLWNFSTQDTKLIFSLLTNIKSERPLFIITAFSFR